MFKKNIIIGAGPAGLQLAYFFEKSGIDYIILEKSDGVASFFTKYPLSGKLISVNKKYTGSDKADFNLRHDWNSLLSDEKMVFTEYSNDYYPDRNDLVDYLTDFSKESKLKIQFQSNVKSISYKENKYILVVGNKEDKEDKEGKEDKETKESKETIYECEKLIVATGLSKPSYPNVIKNYKKEIRHYGEMDTKEFLDPTSLGKYTNKSVLLLGDGNASFELGNILNPISSSVVIFGRNHKKWAMSSHYTGDIRSVYLQFMDTFLLKSLNAIDSGIHSKFVIDQENEESKYNISFVCNNPQCKMKHPLFNGHTSNFDHIIFCTGWKFDASMFEIDVKLTENMKYPAIKYNYESVNNPNLYFIGSLMHSLDFKQSSGGFIHGFRYLIKNFMNTNYELPFEITTFPMKESYEDTMVAIVNHCIEKINYSSPMYQMYGQIGDYFYYDNSKTQFVYYNNIRIENITNDDVPFEGQVGFFITLEYGKDLVTDYTKFGKKVSMLGKESHSTLLHPVIKVFGKDGILMDIVHFDEDIFANYQDNATYHFKMFRTFKMFF